MGGALFGARALQKTSGEKVPGSTPAAARPAQHILLDVDDDEDDEHEEDHKDDEDEDDEEDEG